MPCYALKHYESHRYLEGVLPLRWEELVQTLRDSMTNLVGNMVVCSGAIAYQGPFTAASRALTSALSAVHSSAARDGQAMYATEVAVYATSAGGAPSSALASDAKQTASGPAAPPKPKPAPPKRISVLRRRGAAPAPRCRELRQKDGG